MEADIRDSHAFTIAVDFDGVIHANRQGWQGGEIYDCAFADCERVLGELKKEGCRIVIHTSRVTDKEHGDIVPDQLYAVEQWLRARGIPFDDIWVGCGKPLAHIYIDDRAMKFIHWNLAHNEITHELNEWKTRKARKNFDTKYVPEYILGKEDVVPQGVSTGVGVPTMPIRQHGAEVDSPDTPAIVATDLGLEEQARLAVRTLLKYIGEEPDREGLRETPDRVVRMLREVTQGYFQNPEEILNKKFDESCNEMILSRNIKFHSMCEHHMVNFSGVATVGYIPNSHVVGLSKLSRIVTCFAQRLQVQERMTEQIASAIEEYIQPKGVGVLIQAQHGCMRCRGVKQDDSDMVTSAMLGAFEQQETRTEFLLLAKRGI